MRMSKCDVLGAACDLLTCQHEANHRLNGLDRAGRSIRHSNNCLAGMPVAVISHDVEHVRAFAGRDLFARVPQGCVRLGVSLLALPLHKT